MKITDIQYHRNGSSGDGFYAVTFQNGDRNMVASVFEQPGCIAVFDVDMLAAGNITAHENSWRAEDFEKELRKAVTEYTGIPF